MYEDHYGFTGRPFQLTPDPRFWFDTAAHKKAMSYLGFGLSQGEGFIVITGDVGTGKTTLVGQLLGRIDREQLHAISITSTQIEPEDLLRIVANGLDVAQPGATKADLLTAIEGGLHAVARSGRRTLLVVDEAQALPLPALEELRMLSNISAGGRALLQIFLLGQPEFRETLEGSSRLEQLRQRVIARHHLDPMGADEVEPYMAHRLMAVGWNGRPRFTGEAFEALYQGSGGVPRLLNQLAGRVLLHGALERIETIDADAVAVALSDVVRDVPQPRTDTPAAPPAFMVMPSDGMPAEVPADPAKDELMARLAALEAHTADTAAIEAPMVEQVATLVNRVAMVELQATELAAVAHPDLEQVTDIAERLRGVEAQAHKLAVVSHPSLNQVADIASRLAGIESQTDDLAAAAHSGVDQVSQLAGRVARVELQAGDLAAVTHPSMAQVDALAKRIASLEARMEDQDATLRRVLTLLVDWVETGKRAPVGPISLRA